MYRLTYFISHHIALELIYVHKPLYDSHNKYDQMHMYIWLPDEPKCFNFDFCEWILNITFDYSMILHSTVLII